MKRLRYLDATVGAVWWLVLVVVLPGISLMLAGLVWLWRDGTLLHVLVGWLVLTLLGYALFVVGPGRRASRALQRAAVTTDPDGQLTDVADETTTLPPRLSPGTDWSPRDREIFLTACRRIETLIEGDADWERMRELALAVVGEVAQAYHGERRGIGSIGSQTRLRFTLPEMLLLVSTVSDRYRELVLTHVPFADRIRLSTLATVAENRGSIERGAHWLNAARRGGRLINPIGAVVGELRDQFTGRVFASVSRTLQRDLMRLLLQEIAQVSIDLYSGRLRVTDAELAGYRSRALRQDAERAAEPLEPLRVLLLGQVSAGKSSLVNALARALQAETDPLPSTDRTTVHALALDGLPPLHLIDTAGLDADADHRRTLVDAALQADVLVWVSRATRPGRAPDAELHAAIQARFESHPERRPPVALLVLTHVDQLSPRTQWAPPYPLDEDAPPEQDPAREKKRANLIAALASTRRQIGLDEAVPAIPVRVGTGVGAGADEQPYNVDTVVDTLMMLVEPAAATQLNRRRIDRAMSNGGWRARLTQSRHLALGIGRTLLRSASGADRPKDPPGKPSDDRSASEVPTRGRPEG